MQKKSKLMIYVRADLAPDAIRWAIRLGQTTATFCSQCVGSCLQNMERGLNVYRDVPPHQWESVNVWKLRQGKPVKTKSSVSTNRRALVYQQGEYRKALPKLKEFERAFEAREANLKVVFQVHEGPEAGDKAERWPEKLRRMARHFHLKPNELANRMIAAGIVALEREDPYYQPDFVTEYRQNVVIPKIEQFQGEQKLAEHFNPYSDVPPELEKEGWAFMDLIEATNLHYRELVGALLDGKAVKEAFAVISQDTMLSRAYLDKLKGSYINSAHQDWSEPHPLRDKRLKKEIIDAWVEEWRRVNRSKPSVVEGIISQLPTLSEPGLRRIQDEIAILVTK
jgi:hypothetical protein